MNQSKSSVLLVTVFVRDQPIRVQLYLKRYPHYFLKFYLDLKNIYPKLFEFLCATDKQKQNISSGLLVDE